MPLTVTVRLEPQVYEAVVEGVNHHHPVAAQEAVPAARVTRTRLKRHHHHKGGRRSTGCERQQKHTFPQTSPPGTSQDRVMRREARPRAGRLNGS